jgi:hypothetical protein
VTAHCLHDHDGSGTLACCGCGRVGPSEPAEWAADCPTPARPIPLDPQERIAFGWVVRAWSRIGRDPMAEHDEACGCWRCDAVRDVWFTFDGQAPAWPTTYRS